MKFCACVGAYGLPHFLELNIRLLRMVFGDDLPIAVRDDPSRESDRITEIASKHDCFLKRDGTPLGHFAGDVQAFIDALALADHVGADIAIKMSQRCMVANPDLRQVIERVFLDNPGIDMVLPGKPNPAFIRGPAKRFSTFPCLSDMAFMRRGGITPEMVQVEYEQQVRTSTHYCHVFVELFWDRLRTQQLNGKVYLCPEITDHRQGMPPLYLRRYQNRAEDYAVRARHFGIGGGPWDMEERSKITPKYDPRPRFLKSI